MSEECLKVAEMNRDQLQQQVECPVCKEQFRTPKQLPCQHSFCLQCLQNVHNSDRGVRVRCPECRQEHQMPANGIAGFPTSVPIQRFIEAMNQSDGPQLQPSAPPLTVRNTEVPAVTTINHERTVGDQEIIVRVIPLMEQQDILLSEIGEGQQQMSRNRTQTRNQDAPHISNVQDDTMQSVREANRRYLRHLLKKTKHEAFVKVAIVVMVIVTSSRFIAGAVKLDSDCHDEYRIALYSFVKACFGFFFYGSLSLMFISTNMEMTLSSDWMKRVFKIYVVFTFVWLIIGTVWLFGFYATMKTECPHYVKNWNFHFINFILFLTVVDWIGAYSFLFFFFYNICCLRDKNDDDNVHRNPR